MNIEHFVKFVKIASTVIDAALKLITIVKILRNRRRGK